MRKMKKIKPITDNNRLFDIRFWKSQGDIAIFEAAAEMLNDCFLIRGKMLTSPDFRELLKLFEKHKISYLAVGRYAVLTNGSEKIPWMN